MATLNPGRNWVFVCPEPSPRRSCGSFCRGVFRILGIRRVMPGEAGHEKGKPEVFATDMNPCDEAPVPVFLLGSNLDTLAKHPV